MIGYGQVSPNCLLWLTFNWFYFCSSGDFPWLTFNWFDFWPPGDFTSSLTFIHSIFFARGLDLSLDPDIVAAMDDDFNFEDPENALGTQNYF